MFIVGIAAGRPKSIKATRGMDIWPTGGIVSTGDRADRCTQQLVTEICIVDQWKSVGSLCMT